MKFLFASDSFKGSLTSAQTVGLLTKAARDVFGTCDCVGVLTADGGEGTVDAVMQALHGSKVTVPVHDPLMRPIRASYGVAGETAVIETAAASGLTLIPEELRNPLYTGTCGTGELILDALRRGCRKLYLAIGGSATNDGGMGCMRALGVRFLDGSGSELSGRGGDLSSVARIDTGGMDPRLRHVVVTVLCDVKNPLCGPDGATYTFAQQKGASPAIREQLESGMCHYRDILRAQFGVDCDTIEGAGAAGGLGAALKVFLNAEMRSGIDTVLDLIGFDHLLDGADCVVTGEGRADRQSCCGKVMQGVALRAKAKGIPVVGLCGSLGDGAESLYDCGVTALMAASDGSVSTAYAMAHAEALYTDAAVRMFRMIRDGEL